MTIAIAHNAVTAKLINAPREAKLEVQQLLSFASGSFGASAFGSGAWAGRSTFFEFNPATFPRGFVGLVHAHLTKLGYKVRLVRKPFPAPLGPEKPKVDDFPEDPRYDYQPEVVEKLLRHGQIIAQVATGGGKSRIARLAFARIARRTLFLTTRSILMYQMRDAFEENLGLRAGVFGDSQWTQPQLFNVGMVQTLSDRLFAGDQEAIDLLNSFEFVILEEAHEISNDQYYAVMGACKNAHYRLALTGTPYMKEDEEANMRLMAVSGPVAIKVTEKMLIDRGILARPFFKYIELPDDPPAQYVDANGKVQKLYRSTPYQKAYEVGVIHNERRNKHILYEAARAVRYGLPVMILIQRKEHGKILQRMLTEFGVRTNFIWGEKNQNERKAALLALKEGRIQCLIGSTILDVGVDVPAVGMVILAGAGKAEVAYRQRIGRGLREKKNGMPNVCFVVDFMDPINNHLRDHARQRKAIVERTPGFAEGILSGDFDYAAYGFKRAA